MKLLNINNFYSLITTERCNFSCTYCVAHKRKNTKLSLIEDNIDAVCDFFKTKIPGLISLSGGEPTLAKNITRLLQYLPQYKFAAFINANYLPKWLFFDNFILPIATYHSECIKESDFIKNVHILFSEGKKVIVKIIVKPNDTILPVKLWERLWSLGIPTHFIPLEYDYYFSSNIIHDIKQKYLTSCVYNSRFFRSHPQNISTKLCNAGTKDMFEVSSSGILWRCSNLPSSVVSSFLNPHFASSPEPCSVNNCFCEWHHWALSTRAHENERWTDYIEGRGWKKPDIKEFEQFIIDMCWDMTGRIKEMDKKVYSLKQEATFTSNNSINLYQNDYVNAFKHWFELISFKENRLYYRDQSIESFKSLYNLAFEFKPTVIVELGTLSGMSLRTWLLSAPQAKIKCIDLSFQALIASQKLIPFNTANVELIEKNILHVDFKQLWKNHDRVLFFVDAHDLEKVPIMAHILKNALPYLPKGSLCIIDDIWYTPENINSENLKELFEKYVLHEIDELQIFNANYAPYHKGGYFFGFLEVKPLLKYINKHNIKLSYEQNCKHVYFYTDEFQQSASFDNEEFLNSCGVFNYHPLNSIDSNSQLLKKIFNSIKILYTKNKIETALQLIVNFIETNKGQSNLSGLWYSLALLLLRGGIHENVVVCLKNELSLANPHYNAKYLLKDFEEKFCRFKFKKDNLKKGLTLFSVPKPFTGHNAVIQRNAILSWLKLNQKADIILLGNEEGVAEIANEFNLIHIPHLKSNEFGTPLVDDIIYQAQSCADTEVLCYINSDIIIFDKFMEAAMYCSRLYQEFLMIGQRMDYEQNSLIDFTKPDWAKKIQENITEKGVLHAPTGLDYFVFRSGLWINIPPFALGRTAWDTWLFNSIVKTNIITINATKYVTIGHQNHDYNHAKGGGGKQEIWYGTEAIRNRCLAEGMTDCHVLHSKSYLDENCCVMQK